MSPQPDFSGDSRTPRGTGSGGRPEHDGGSVGIPGEHEDTAEPAAVFEDDLGAALELAQRERDEYLEMLRRLQADFENYKKRMLRQQTELLERAAEGLVLKLLPALDAFDLARMHLGDVEEASPEGKALVQASALLFDSLAKEGLERLDDTGVPFDPTTHDAVEHETGDQTASRDAGDPAAADEAGAGEPVPAADGAREGASPAEGLSASEPVVVAVLRAGYRWKGRVIRPPMVRVRG